MFTHCYLTLLFLDRLREPPTSGSYDNTNPPSRRGLLFGIFPNQEPGGRAPPSKHLVQILLCTMISWPLAPGGVSYLACSVTKNPEEEDPSRRTPLEAPGTNSSTGVFFCGFLVRTCEIGDHMYPQDTHICTHLYLQHTHICTYMYTLHKHICTHTYTLHKHICTHMYTLHTHICTHFYTQHTHICTHMYLPQHTRSIV